MILHVAERIAHEAPEYRLIFAVDHCKLFDLLKENGYQAIMTLSTHQSGSDRLAEANKKVGAAFVINVQADEPLVTRRQITTLAHLVQGECDIATLATPFSHPKDFFDPNQVKVVLNRNSFAIYFSRAPIPYPRDKGEKIGEDWLIEHRAYRHLGLYAYRAEFLKTFTTLPPGKLESVEKLEQLRAIENGYRIAVGITDEPGIGIDTPKDAEIFAQMLSIGQARRSS